MTVPGPVIDLKTRPHGRIRVDYKDPSSFHHDWLKHIRRSGLFIREQLSEPVGSEREIELILPSGKTLNCTAQIVAPMPSGTGLALQLKPSQLRELEYEAQRSQPS